MWIYAREIGMKEVTPAIKKKLDFEYECAPPGMAFYLMRRSKIGNDKFIYVDYGETREECALKANRFVLQQIAELEVRIERFRSKLVK